MAEENWYDPLVNLGSSAWDWLLDGDNAEGIGGLLSAGGTALGLFQNDQATAGYQGKIPEYTTVRKQLPNSNPGRRPGGGGQRYFTDTYYGQTPEDQQTVGSLANAQAAADAQKAALVAQNPEQFARGGIVGALNSMYGGGKGGGSGYGNSNRVGQQLSGSADDIGSPPRRNPYGNVDNWDASAWQNMVSQVQATEPQMSDPIMTQGGPADDPRFQPGGAWYQKPGIIPWGNDDMAPPAYIINDMGNSPAWKEAMTNKMYGNAFAKSGVSVEELYRNAGIPFKPNAPTPTIKPDTNSPAWKEAMTNKMYGDAFAKSGVSVEELYRNAGIPNPNVPLPPLPAIIPNDDDYGNYPGGPNNPLPDVFTGGSQYFDESTGQYTGGPNAPKSMPPRGMAQGGIVNAMPRAYLNGSSDGMGDQVPAMIDNQRPASLSHGEMVIPADVVSHMGNGNSDAGAKQFYDMMDRVRKARTGNKQQGKQINPNKFMPR
jgi:hypothetical protein